MARSSDATLRDYTRFSGNVVLRRALEAVSRTAHHTSSLLESYVPRGCFVTLAVKTVS